MRCILSTITTTTIAKSTDAASGLANASYRRALAFANLAQSP